MVRDGNYQVSCDREASALKYFVRTTPWPLSLNPSRAELEDIIRDHSINSYRSARAKDPRRSGTTRKTTASDHCS
jgi:hypothetical protein